MFLLRGVGSGSGFGGSAGCRLHRMRCPVCGFPPLPALLPLLLPAGMPPLGFGGLLLVSRLIHPLAVILLRALRLPLAVAGAAAAGADSSTVPRRPSADPIELQRPETHVSDRWDRLALCLLHAGS